MHHFVNLCFTWKNDIFIREIDDEYLSLISFDYLRIRNQTKRLYA